MLIYIVKECTCKGFFYLLAAVREQVQKANCEMSGYEVAAGGAPDFVGHLPETDAVPQGSGAPASLARECWAEQVQQPEALAVQEATVSLEVHLQ